VILNEITGIILKLLTTDIGNLMQLLAADTDKLQKLHCDRLPGEGNQLKRMRIAND